MISVLRTENDFRPMNKRSRTVNKKESSAQGGVISIDSCQSGIARGLPWTTKLQSGDSTQLERVGMYFRRSSAVSGNWPEVQIGIEGDSAVNYYEP